MAYDDVKKALELNNGRVIINQCEFDENINNKLKNYNYELSSACKERIAELYNLYEFSDEILMINSTPLYPSLFNYVKTGILTEEEMIQALFNKA